ncbi:FUSC family protein [Acidisoma sp.]|uniref:FUSC family protein n=1 Tax=Acidisoma sp. TaxID=1872115 RepID=UPI003B0046E7
MAAACTTVVLLCEIWQQPELDIPTLVTLMVWQQDRVANIKLGLALTGLTTLTLGILFVVMKLTVDQPFSIAVAVAVLSFVFFFLGSASKLKPVAYLVGLIVVYGLITVDDVPIGDLITRALLYTELFVAIPGAIMVVLGLLISPSPKTLLTDAIAERLRASAALLRGCRPDQREQALDLLREGDAGMLKLGKSAAAEHLWKQQNLAALEQAARSAVALLALADAAADQGGTAPAALVQVIDDMATIFADGDYPVAIEAPMPPSGLSLQAIAVLLPQFTTPVDAGSPASNKKSGFFSPDAFSNPAHTRYALKGTAAVLASYFLFKILDWPGIHTMIITCFIVALPTLGEMIHKIGLRVTGALIGGALGIGSIIWVMPHLDGITPFLLLIATVSLLAAWLRVGDERISYMGFQVGLAFYLTVLQGYGPTTDMTPARDRIVGILLGIVITYAIYTTAWPESAYSALRERRRALARALMAQRHARGLIARAGCAGAVQSAISAMERTLEQACVEPRHLQQQMTQLDDCRRALDRAARQSEAMLSDPRARLPRDAATS